MKKIIIPEVIYYGGRFHKGKAILIIDGVIAGVDVPEALPCDEMTATERWEQMAMLPGTINVHNHSFQSLLRGLAVGKPFLVWRDEALYKISPMLTADDLYVGALFAFGEMMKYGVTCVCDYFYVHNEGLECDRAIIRAAHDLGIRLVLARTMYDWRGAPAGYVESIDDAVARTRLLAQEFNGKDRLMTTVLPAPHSLHAASTDMICAGHALAGELGTKFHIHVAEEMFEVDEVRKTYRMRPVELFDRLGVLDRSMVMVHAVWLNDGERALMAQKQASLAYCPGSNMFLADGVTRIDEMLAAGIRIGLGTDGACSNNRISVFEEMRMASLLQKVTRLNAQLIDADVAFRMGTEWGGELLDLPVGEIRTGYKADLVGVDLTDWSLQPLYPDYEQLLPHIVYSMQPTAIRRVMVDGQLTVDEGKIMRLPQQQINGQIAALMNRIYKQSKK
ncbi:MAG: amidohydrolase family protein [Tannerellaceae bacterium]|jgi:5-methylthioadenosine/S-adenosylhomocysteine deaminase|nr:amidohydrolase family protein [Tannerellaceae bacterium]